MKTRNVLILSFAILFFPWFIFTEYQHQCYREQFNIYIDSSAYYSRQMVEFSLQGDRVKAKEAGIKADYCESKYHSYYDSAWKKFPYSITQIGN